MLHLCNTLYTLSVMKMVRIDDAIYDVLVANAAEDQRTIFAYTNRLIAQALADSAVLVAEPVTKPNPYASAPAPATMGYACCVSKAKRCNHWEHN